MEGILAKTDDVSKREDVVINVQPYMATAVIGMFRGYSRSIFDYINMSTKPHGMVMAESFYDEIQNVLDEIYEKCIARTNLRERAKDFLEMVEMTGGVMPSDEVH